MRAALLRSIGATLEYGEVADPVAGEGEVVVEVTHASVNPLDLWITRGAPGAAAAHLPWIPGTEGAGRLDGRPVLVRGGGLGLSRHGVFAQRVAAPREAVVELPEGCAPAVAAALGVAGLTAFHCVGTYGDAGPADRVLVLGASGGVGSLAVQLAAARGARVWAQTTSPSKADEVAALGAERVVVAEAHALASAVAEFAPTLVIDGLGGGYTRAAVDALQPRGRLVLYGASAGDDIALSSRGFYRKGLTLHGYTGFLEPAERQSETFARLLAMTVSGALRVPVELVPLSRAQSAFDRILARGVVGKLVLDTAV